MGAALWIGGLVHLVVFWRVTRRYAEAADAVRVLRRFSTLAVTAVIGLAGAGAVLSWLYIDSLGGLVGTGYGVMVLSKIERGWPKVPEWVFCTETGTRPDESRIRKIMRKTLKAVALPLHFSPHCLRHTFASLLLQQGESPAYVQRSSATPRSS